MSKGYRSPPEKVSNGQSWKNYSKKINNGVSDYNIKYKISIYEFTK